MRVIEFFTSCIPPRTGSKTNYRAVTSKSTGKTHVFKGEKATESMATWFDILKDHKPEMMLQGACRLRIELFFPLIASDTSNMNKRIEIQNGHQPWMTTRPDATNMIEAVQDIMTKQLYFKDDSQLVDVRVTKRRSKQPGVFIRLEEIGE